MTIDWRTQIFPRRDDLPADITSIDVLKAVAITLMIIDHVGWLLFPQIEWFRVFGRMCVPLWFFLIGYVNTRDIPVRWLVAGIILMISNIIIGLPPLPLSVLFTMAAIRLVIDPLWGWLMRKPIYYWWVVLLLIFASYATDLFIEYGTMGLLMAMAGYAVRHRETVDGHLGEGISVRLMVVVLASFGILETLQFGFSMLGALVLAGGLVGVYFALQQFTYKVYPNTADHNSAPLVRFMGRYTLEIYVIHLLILKGVFGLQMLAVNLIG